EVDGVRGVRFTRTAVTGQVRRDHPPAVRERIDGVPPHRARRAEPVHQEERRTAAGFLEVDTDAVDENLACAHGRLKIAAEYATVGGGSCGAPPKPVTIDSFASGTCLQAVRRPCRTASATCPMPERCPSEMRPPAVLHGSLPPSVSWPDRIMSPTVSQVAKR